MIREAMEFVRDLTAKSLKMERIHDGAKIKVFSDPNTGEFRTFVVPESPDSCGVYDIQSLADFVKVRGGEGEVWFNESHVALRIPREDGEDSVVMAITMTPEYRALTTEKWLSQSSMILVFESELHADIGPAVDDALEAIRHLKFVSKEESDSKQTAMSSKMGKTIDRDVTGANTIPSQLEVIVRPMVEFDIEVPLSVRLDIDLEKELLRLRPLSSSLCQARQLIAKGMRDVLSENIPAVPLFFGAIR